MEVIFVVWSAGRFFSGMVWFDDIADTSDGMNHFHLKYVIYFRTQIADIDVNDVGLTDEIISAHSVEQCVSAQNNILVLKEGSKHQELSVRRANAVKDLLVKKYGIDESRITAEGCGTTKDKYETYENNRVAMLFFEK